MTAPARLTAARARLGDWIYRRGTRAEAALYGLVTARVAAADVTLALDRGGPPSATEVLLLVHGYSGDRLLWARFARHLVDRYAVVIPDLAGHGDTGFVPGADYTAPAQARRLVALLDALGYDRAHVVGNSMGGLVAAHLALAAPARVQTLTLLDPLGVTSPEPSDMGRMLDAGRNPFEVRTQAEFRELYAMTMARPPWLPRSVLLALGERYRARRAALAEIFPQIHPRDGLDDRLGEIAAPTLVMWGALDRLIHPSAAPRWADGIPDARLIVYDDLGHMPMLEDPRRAARDVRAFIEGRDR